MSTDIVIPALGESVSEGVIASWLKSDGEWADRDEPVLELETDKITMEIPAPSAGVVHPSVNAGETVAVGATVGSIDESAQKPTDDSSEQQTSAKRDAKPEAKSRSKPGTASKGDSGKEREAGSAVSASKSATIAAKKESTTPDQAHATPLARKIATDHRLDLSGISGTGPGGRIREQDVLAFIQAHPNGAAPTGTTEVGGAGVGGSGVGETGVGETDAGGTGVSPVSGSRAVTRERMSPLRQRIAVRLVEAQHTAAMLTTFNECDMTAVMELRRQHKDAFEKKHGVGLGFMSFFVKACVSALEAVPNVNSQIGHNDKGEPEIIRHSYCDIAVAVGTPKGLVVPVVRNCETLAFAGIESAIRELAARARVGKLTLEEMQGGTFTISNGGVYGSMLSTPILNPPQSGILGMHNIIRRPVENPDKPGSGEVVVRPMMYLALSYDHRVVDGEGAVTFLKHVKERLESPERMLLGV